MKQIALILNVNNELHQFYIDLDIDELLCAFGKYPGGLRVNISQSNKVRINLSWYGEGKGETLEEATLDFLKNIRRLDIDTKQPRYKRFYDAIKNISFVHLIDGVKVSC